MGTVPARRIPAQGRNDGLLNCVMFNSRRSQNEVVLGGTGHPLDVLAERSIDVRLVSPAVTSTGLEPGDDVRVDPQRNLLLYGPVEDPAPGVGPVENLRGAGRVDLVLRQSLQRPYLAPERPDGSSVVSFFIRLPLVPRRLTCGDDAARSLRRSPCRSRAKHGPPSRLECPPCEWSATVAHMDMGLPASQTWDRRTRRPRPRS